MKKSVQLAIRASEIRSEINGLEPGDATIEKRRELLASLNTVESEYRTALTTEADSTGPDAQRPHRRGARIPPARNPRRAAASVSAAS